MSNVTIYSTEIAEHEMKITSQAQAQMAALMGEADDDVEAIRVFVTGGGCSGMTYGMTYADSTTPLDKILSGDGFKIVVDAVALNYLQGCEIDYSKEGFNESFVFNNVFQQVGGSGACGGCGGGGCA